MKGNANTGRRRRDRLKVIETDSPYLPRYVLGDCYTSDHRPRRRGCGNLKTGEHSGRNKVPHSIFNPLPKRIRTALYYQLSPEERDKIDMK